VVVPDQRCTTRAERALALHRIRDTARARANRKLLGKRGYFFVRATARASVALMRVCQPRPVERKWWHRDLALDLDRVRDWGAAAVVTLLEPRELTLLRVECLGEEVLRRNMLWFHLPVVDASIPDERFESRWAVVGEELRLLLGRGLDVLVHCCGGLGRAGTIAARLLVELGMEPTKAIATVRAVRPGAIENGDQEKFLLRLTTTRK